MCYKNRLRIAALSVSIACLLNTSAFGLILYSGDNGANLSAPDAARADAFASVARIANANAGSAVAVRGKYLLTANHVSIGSGFVSFDGFSNLSIDTAFGSRRIGATDMKVFKLVDDPGLPEIELNRSKAADVGAIATFIGFGVGRDPNVSDSGFGRTNIWSWGPGNTIDKRWGTNQIAGSFEANSPPFQFTYESLFTRLESIGLDANEAAATLFDSGSGLFIETGGIWRLAGITTAVTTSGSSTFSSTGDSNFFVRIAEYASAIDDAIPDLSHYPDWRIDNILYGADAADDADTDLDNTPLIFEFAFGGDPTEPDRIDLPFQRIISDNGMNFLELVVNRRVGLTGITYQIQTTTDLSNWPTDSAGIVDDQPIPVLNNDGTETLVYRRAQPLESDQNAYIRLRISPSN